MQIVDGTGGFEYLAGETVLVIVAHADDPTLFCGGTLALMADAGARVVMLRVTRDQTDSIGLDPEETARLNTSELAVAAALLGISEVVDLGYESDQLADVRETELREHFIRAVRRFRPYAVISYDPYGAFHEDNQDHICVGAAVDETYWTAMFDKHHPEHIAAGLEPHGVVERWYFARDLVKVTTVVDVGSGIERKIEAACAQRTMLTHIAHQLTLLALTARADVPMLSDAIADPRSFATAMIRAGSGERGSAHGLAYAEEFRVVRFAGFEALFAGDT